MKLAGRVAIIVTVRERFGTTVRCLEALIAHTPRDVPIVLVMPPGGDRIRGRIDALAVRRAIRIVAGDGANTHNADRNLGAQHVPAVEYLVFVENDTIVTWRWLERLVARADATGADLVGPLLWYPGYFLNEPNDARILNSKSDVLQYRIESFKAF